MFLSPLALGLLALSALATGVLSAVIGMGGGIVLLSLMTLVLPLGVVVPIHGLVQLISNGGRSLLLIKDVRRSIVGAYFVGLPVGAYLAYTLIRQIANPSVLLLLIAAVIFFSLFAPKRLQVPPIPIAGFAVLGMLVGLLGPLVGATGPLTAPFFLRDDLDPQQLVATKATCQLMGHLSKIPIFLALSFPYIDHLQLILILSLMTLIGTWIGVILLKHLSPKLFVLLYRVALFVVACRIVYLAIRS